MSGPGDRSSVERLKDAIYSRTKKPFMKGDVRTPLAPSSAHAPVTWESDAPREAASLVGEGRPEPLARPRGWSLPAKFLAGSIVFFGVAVGVAAWIFFGGINLISPKNIDIQIVAPSVIDSGKEAMFQILITNRNQTALQETDLILTYPAGTRAVADQTQSLPYERQTIGTIARGEQVKQTAQAVIYGAAGGTQKVVATVEYRLAGSNTIFTKSSEIEFVIGSAPVSLSVTMPNEAIAGQTFPVTIVAQSNATTRLDAVAVQGEYPFGFSVLESTPPAESGGTLWRLGSLEPGASKKITLTAVIDGQDGDQRVVRFLAGSNVDATDARIKVPFLSMPSTIAIRRPFITGSIAINGQTGKTIALPVGQPVTGTVTWQNNLPTAVSDVELTLALSGPLLDQSSVNVSNGFYRSSDSSIVWTKSNDPTLGSIPAGGSGSVQFSFTTVAPGDSGVLYANPTINLNLTISGRRAGESGVPEVVSSAAVTQINLASAVSLVAQAFHFSGPFVNGGSMPPRAEQSTQYTILWTVKNSSNTIANASVSTILPPYVSFVQGQAGVTYDKASRTVTWSPGDIKAGVGYTSAGAGAAFQVALTPSVSQVGQSPALTGPITLVGQDRFAQTSVSAVAPAPSTILSSDGASYNPSMSAVISK